MASRPLAIPHSSSTTSLQDSEDDDQILYHPVPSPCSPSILRNPLHASPSNDSSLPGAAASSSSTSSTSIESKRRPSILAQMVSVVAEPPAHWAAENGWSPPRGEGRYSRSNSASRVTEDASLGAAATAGDEGASLHSGNSEEGSKLKFAPLPPGRRQYRSNSLTLGVAARAKMIQGQGAAPNVHQARYAGPQQWYQPGAAHPDDVYTYKDVQRGLGKIWKKVRRRSSASETAASTSSRDSNEAREMETKQKSGGKSKEIEHIEEAEEEEEDGFYEEVEESRGRGAEARALGMDMGQQARGRTDSLESESTTEGSDPMPQTPEDAHNALPPLSARRDKGKGVDPRERAALV